MRHPRTCGEIYSIGKAAGHCRDIPDSAGSNYLLSQYDPARLRHPRACGEGVKVQSHILIHPRTKRGKHLRHSTIVM